MSKIKTYVVEPIVSSAVVQWFVAGFAVFVVWLIYLTCCNHVRNKKVLREYRNKPAIFVVWHGRTMVPSVIMALYRMRSCAVASRHKDGRLMAKIQRLFGATAIYGSTSAGAVSVLREGVRVLHKEKRCIVMCPDGPSGPSLHLQDGAMYFAKMANAPIIPVCFSSSKSWFQTRWDRYLVTLPFAKTITDIGDPIFVKSDIKTAAFEKEREKIEKICIKQLRNLDKIFNLMQVEEGATATEFKRKLREAKKLEKQGKR